MLAGTLATILHKIDDVHLPTVAVVPAELGSNILARHDVRTFLRMTRGYPSYRTQRPRNTRRRTCIVQIRSFLRAETQPAAIETAPTRAYAIALSVLESDSTRCEM